MEEHSHKHPFGNYIKGAILTNFPAEGQEQCNFEIREQKLPYLKEASMTTPQLKDAAYAH